MEGRISEFRTAPPTMLPSQRGLRYFTLASICQCVLQEIPNSAENSNPRANHAPCCCFVAYVADTPAPSAHGVNYCPQTLWILVALGRD